MAVKGLNIDLLVNLLTFGVSFGETKHSQAVMLRIQDGTCNGYNNYSFDSRYFEVVGTISYKFKLPEVQINLFLG